MPEGRGGRREPGADNRFCKRRSISNRFVCLKNGFYPELPLVFFIAPSDQQAETEWRGVWGIKYCGAIAGPACEAA